MPNVALGIHLRLLPLRRGGEGHDPEDAWAHTLGDGLDGPALSGPIPPLEDNADLEALELDPFLEVDQLRLQLGQRLFIGLALELVP